MTATTTATALNLGWTMAELYRHDWCPKSDPPVPSHDLPGIGAFSRSQKTEMRLDAIDACFAALHDTFTAAGQNPQPSTTDVRDLYQDPNSSAGQAKKAINKLHFDIARTLSASDPNLGKSYGLGRALSDTIQSPDDQADLAERFKHFRLATLRRWLNDLATDLPAHAAKGVLLSLSRWEAWTANVALATDDEWAAAGESVRRSLRKQGELWRAAICGEKNPLDVLTTDDYVDAANNVARRGLMVTARALARYGGIVALAVVVVVALAIFVVSNPTSQLVTGIAAAAAALGITWKGVGSISEKLALALGRPLWGAALDTAVADGITALPLSPVREPVSDLLILTPQYLRACAVAAPADELSPEAVSGALRRRPLPGASRLSFRDFLATRAAGRGWRSPDPQQIHYWFVWAQAADLIKQDGGGIHPLTPAGAALARIPQHHPGTVRAKLTAG